MSLRKLEIHIPAEYKDDVLEALTSGGGGIGNSDHVGEFLVVTPSENCVEVSATCTAARAGELVHLLTTQLGVGVQYGTITCLNATSLRPNPNQLVSEFAAMKKLLESEERRRERANADGDGTGRLTHALTLKHRERLDKRKFQYVRATTTKSVEELFNEIIDLSDDGWEFYLNVACASVISGMGLLTDSSVVVLSAMLISPLMGPILSAAFGLAVRDWELFRESALAECRAAAATSAIGLLIGFAFGDLSVDYGASAIPTREMSSRGQVETLISGAVIAAASGVVVGSSITSDGVNSLVGVAISASLLPPLVNSGLLIAFAVPGIANGCGEVGNEKCTSTASGFLQMAGVSFILYVMNVFIIMTVAAAIFTGQKIGSLRGFQDASNKRLLNFTQRQVRDKLKLAVGLDLLSIETEEAIDKIRRERLANDALARRAEENEQVEEAKHANAKNEPAKKLAGSYRDEDKDQENFEDARSGDDGLVSPPKRKRPYNPNYSVLRPFPEPAGVERPAFLDTAAASNVGNVFTSARNTIVSWLQPK